MEIHTDHPGLENTIHHWMMGKIFDLFTEIANSVRYHLSGCENLKLKWMKLSISIEKCTLKAVWGKSATKCSLQALNFSSVYLWDLDHGFAGVILIKKTGDTTPTGSWDSIHVFECKEKTRSASYKLTTTVMMWLQTNNKVNFRIFYQW